MENNYKIYEGTVIGKFPLIGDYAVIGVPAKAAQDKPCKIGDNAQIRSHTVIYQGNQIGNNFQTGHSAMIRENNIIGDDVSIGTHSIVEHDVKIGNNVRIHSSAFIPEFTVLEDDCWVGPNVVFTNAKYPKSKDAKNNLKGAVVKKGAKIGANATILPGITIGENALVGAGAVVTKDVPAGKVVLGNPAKIENDVEDIPDYQSE